MIEHLLAQIVLNPLAQNAREEDENEYSRSLKRDHSPVDHGDIGQRDRVVRRDAHIDDLFTQISEVRIEDHHEGNCREEAGHPLPVRARLHQDALDGLPVELGGKFFFFKLVVVGHTASFNHEEHEGH